MTREIEADGFITRKTDLKQTDRKVCANCKHLKRVADWRMKYEVCDKWEKEE